MNKYKEVLIDYSIPCFTFLIISVSVLFQSPFTPFLNGYINSDSGVFLYNGWMLSEGFLPYSDTWDNKGLLLYFINMVGILINYNHGLWFVEVVSLFICAIFLYKTFRIFTSKIISTLSVIYILIVLGGLLWGGNYTEEFALPFSFIAIYIYIKYVFDNSKYRNFQLVYLGLTFVATLMLRPNIAVIWPAFTIVYFYQMIKEKNFSNIIKYSIFFIIGMMLALLPCAYYLLSNNIMYEFFYSTLLNPLGFEKLSLVHRLEAVGHLLYTLNKFGGWILIVSAGFYTTVTYLLFKKQFITNKIKIIYYTTIIGFIFNLYANSLSGYSYVHYALTFVPILSIPSMIMIDYSIQWIKKRGGYNKKIKYFPYIYISIILVLFLLQGLVYQCILIKDNINYQDKITEYILSRTNNSDKIQILSYQTGIYYRVKRQAASKFSYILTNGAFEDAFEKVMVETIYNDIIEQKPSIVVLSNEHENYLDNTNFIISNKSNFEEFIQTNYSLDKIIDQAGQNKIFLRK